MGMATPSEEAIPSKLFPLPSKKGITLKERICRGQILSFYSRPLFRRDSIQEVTKNISLIQNG